MKRSLATFASVLALGAALSGPAAAGPPAGSIVVTMSGFRNDRGMLRISLFASKKGYPGEHTRAVRTGSDRIKGTTATFRFEGVPHGTYAIAVLHDENGNGKMDTNAIGIPREGGGASNDAKARFGPPKFDEAKFVLRDARLDLRLKIRYP
jgi:uncharacterized protein (DUF2141 family)